MNPTHSDRPAVLGEAEIRSFVEDGFVRLDHAFPKRFAQEGRAILWPETGCDPDDPETWTKPVVRLGYRGEPPFAQAVNAPCLHAAFDRLCGPGRWRPRRDLGTFPVRFPSPEDPGDSGWHVDVSFPPDGPWTSYCDWRVNLLSRDRALLMLFLFSDVGEDDAPTRIRVASHLDVARLLEPAGEHGLDMMTLAEGLDVTEGCEEMLAIGEAGTVYLCHPFLAHAAQPHRGSRPRFLAQPPLPSGEPYRLDRPESETSPVEAAIRLALGR